MHLSTLKATVYGLLYGTDDFAEPLPESVCFAGNLIVAETPREKVGNKLQSIFTHLNGEHPDAYIPATEQVNKVDIIKSLRKDICWREWDENQLLSLLQELEDRLSCIPSDMASDISRYDQSRITAAIASCMEEYQRENEVMLKKEPELRAEKAFLLYSADFSGIQNFIFTVATKGALASLRSRSFLLELLMEHYIDELLSACGMSRVNLLYSGGGHCYLLLPNTAFTEQILKQWNSNFNEWLMEQFGVQLYIAHGWSAVSANDLTNFPAERAPYTAMFRRVSAEISRHKFQRYSAKQLMLINSRTSVDKGRECVVCGRSDKLDSNSRCSWCNLFVNMSGKILDCPVYMVSRNNNSFDFELPGWDEKRYVTLINEKTALSRKTAEKAVVRIYTKNRTFEALPNAVRLYVGDYSASRSTEELAQNAKGISRLAVCRMDVDNLGHAFVSGYRKLEELEPNKRDIYLNISRTSAFSRQMSQFFKHSINAILEEQEPDGHSLSVAIVYSGGDDVFLVGAWNDVISAALRIQSAFNAFCGGALTLSAGISIHNFSFPIRQAAAYSAELEDKAKQTPGKNSLALFDSEADHVYSWQEFREKVIGEKKKMLEAFFQTEEQERGNSFLYRLLELLRQAQGDKINIARYAYLLARMEPKEKFRQESYKLFSDAMYRWALSEQDRKQLITAIYIYVYEERKAK